MERLKPQEIDPGAVAQAAGIAATLIAVFLIVVVAFSLELVTS